MADGPTDSRRPFHGPWCWALSALLGMAVGVALAFTVPTGKAPTRGPGAGDAPTVIQQSSSGAVVERLADYSTRPVAPTGPGTTGAANPIASPAASLVVHGAPPLWLAAPFVILLASIALLPLLGKRFWHHHYPDIAFALGGVVLAYSLLALGSAGRQDMLHAGREYLSFIALVGGLYVASGGVLIDVRDRGTPARNTLLLAVGCVLANVLGTTGASVLLIRPFLRMNKGRLRPVHVVFFILTVSNCAGCLTPIGDPPLYLGYLKGVPFFWTLTHLWPMWLLVNGCLLVAFFVVDCALSRGDERTAWQSGGGLRSPIDLAFDPQDRTPLIVGWRSLAFLTLLVGGVFIDPLIGRWGGGASWLRDVPVGPVFQIAMAIAAYASSRPSIRHSNRFSFEPLKEVAFLFAGIFLTMSPALAFLSANASSLGLETPTQYYFLTGSLSAVLDNAPTYASFLQVALGTLHVPVSEAGIAEFIDSVYELTHTAGPLGGTTMRFHGQTLLEAVSLGAVLFGALTYIGNGPNFMVKSIVDGAFAEERRPEEPVIGTRMPSFFGYMMLAGAILGPILVLNWAVFIR